VGALTGPNLAQEILAGHAAATVVAFSDDHIATELQRIFASEVFRVYTNPDVIGC
jgi:glycerol-3-phosphate dehydrogenase (NAD(P)+)